jgi:hypothetical protein
MKSGVRPHLYYKPVCYLFIFYWISCMCVHEFVCVCVCVCMSNYVHIIMEQSFLYLVFMCCLWRNDSSIFQTSSLGCSPSSGFLNCPCASAKATPTASPCYTLYRSLEHTHHSCSRLRTDRLRAISDSEL